MRHVSITALCAVLIGCLTSGFSFAAHAAAAPASVYLEELTSPELRAMVAAGHTTVLLPIGGTEQNGPHMVLGKHNVRVRFLAGQIAQQLGNAVVAPVLTYVPEGNVRPPAAHMRFAGTISISNAAFEAVLEGAARSFKQHGFRDIVFLGDHGGYQKSEASVAERLNREWVQDPSARVHTPLEYYASASNTFNQILRDKGYDAAEIGVHAGLADTAMALAVDKNLVRIDQLASAAAQAPANGVIGDPRRASAELGQLGLQHTIDATVTAVRNAVRKR